MQTEGQVSIINLQRLSFYFATRYFQRKEEEREPSKVTLQVSAKGIKLVADSLRHFVPSHAVTYVSQGPPPDDDIVSVILLLYNPITKCPVHLHAYRCDSVETADLLAEQLQLLVDLPDNQRKISELEQRLHSQGLYPSSGISSSTGLAAQSGRMLLKSRDTGLGGSSGDLLADSSSSSEEIGQSRPAALSTDPTVSKTDQERIARLYDSLAAELRDKLGGALSGKTAPILLPPKDYEPQTMTNKKTHNRPRKSDKNNAGSSSGPSSGIGSDLEDPPNKRSTSTAQRDTTTKRRYSYHEPQQQQQQQQQQPEVVVRRRDPVARQWSERRDYNNTTLLNRRSMSDLRYRQQSEETTLRRREESCRDIRASVIDNQQQPSRVKETLSKFEPAPVNQASRSRSFREVAAVEHHLQQQQQASAGWNNIMKYRRPQPYQELDQKERFPGLDRDTARVVEPILPQQQQQQQNRNNHVLQRHKSSEFTSSLMKRSAEHQHHQQQQSVVVVEPTTKVGKSHFRAIRQPN